MAVTVANLGFPRMGPRRELKAALEGFWAGRTDEPALLKTAADLRVSAWRRQRALGVSHIPGNDFSLYDHVLDTSVMLGAIPTEYGWSGGPIELATYFALARGADQDDGHTHGVAAAEMTKWFDTNYHYLVPDLVSDQTFRLGSTKPVDEFLEAKAIGIHTRPVLLGPVTYLKLAKMRGGGDPRELLTGLLPVYGEILSRLAEAGADWVQIDEPCLVLDLDDKDRAALHVAYAAFARVAPSIRVMLTTYFGGLGDNLVTALALPIAGLHLDLVRAPDQLDRAIAAGPPDLVLSLGVVDGRNVWRADLDAILARLGPLVAEDRDVIIAPSCSLQHSPLDLALEKQLEPETRSWLAFGIQKLQELALLARALNGDDSDVEGDLTAARAALAARGRSARIHDPAVAARIAQAGAALARRPAPLAERLAMQRIGLGLPAFPTTTIGSFPQTEAVRRARARRDRHELSDEAYEGFLRDETASAVRLQEEIGLDVLVHGEFERNDMVQYFGEQLSGFAFTRHGWVQSYGSRCVRPPILYGDVSRPAPMTVAWWRFAQSLTDRPMKGMLTGPVTILNWSFVRDDLPRAEVCRQIALAIRDEVCDLEAAGAKIIQVDEAALREGLPLRRGEWARYLAWAVDCFRLASSGVADATQIHTHMCYSEFNDILDAISAMDADVISIETARSKMELLDAFRDGYRGEVGPGVYDIHSPRVPTEEEMAALLASARERLTDDQLWVNPDCGLKTRGWPETRQALVNMVAAARRTRAEA